MKKNFGRKLKCLAISAMACAVLAAGCANKTDLNEAVAVINGEELPLGMAKFYAKIQQVTYETYYGSLFGEDMWSQSFDGTTTFGDSTREGVLEELKQMYIINQHAAEYNVSLSEEDNKKIEETAAKFMKDNSSDAKTAMGADEEQIKKFLSLYTVQSRVMNAILEGVDREVSDEEAAQKTISYVVLSAEGEADEEGNTAEPTEEELANKKAEATKLSEDSIASGDFEATVTNAGLTSSKTSYKNAEDEDASLDSAVLAVADELSDGETSDVIETEDGFYVVNMVSTFDKDATETRKAEIISERESEYFENLYSGWEEASEITINEKTWAKVQFDGNLSMYVKENTEATAEEPKDGAADNEAAGDTSDTTEDGAADTEAEPQSEEAGQTSEKPGDDENAESAYVEDETEGESENDTENNAE